MALPRGSRKVGRPDKSDTIKLVRGSYQSATKNSWNSSPRVKTSKPVASSVQVIRERATTPGYYELRRGGGLLLPLPYRYHKITSQYPKGNYKRREFMIDGYYNAQGQFVKTFSGFFTSVDETGIGVGQSGPYPLQDLSPWILECRAQIDEQVRREFLLKLKDQKINFAQTLAESKQLTSLLSGTVNKLAMMYRELRRGNLRNAAEWIGWTSKVSKRAQGRFYKKHKEALDPRGVSRLMADGVLTLQYGIKPLLADVTGAAELLAQRRHEPLYSQCSKTKRLVFSKRELLTPEGIVNYGSANFQLMTRIQASFSTNDPIHLATQVGVFNPALLAWELLPWSFVADHFMKIGDTISALDATAGLQFIAGCTSVKEVLKTTRSFQETYTSSSLEIVGSGFESQTEESFRRITTVGFPEVPLPSFRVPSAEQVLSDIALLVSTVGKIKLGQRV